MKLRNKKTGEILGSLGSFILQNPNGINCEAITKYNSLAELNEEWEDYEEPKKSKDHWFIQSNGIVKISQNLFGDTDYFEDMANEIGNLFETKEEAEKAVEKLKAWKRLEEAGFMVNSWNGSLGGEDHYDCCGRVNITAEVGDKDKRATVKADLDLLFSQEDE